MSDDKTKGSRDARLNAERLAGEWLAKGNEAKERGDSKRAERCFAAAQDWLDLFNKLSGND